MLKHGPCESRNVFLCFLRACVLNRGDIIPKGQKLVLEGAKKNLKSHFLMYRTQIYISCIDRYTVYI